MHLHPSCLTSTLPHQACSFSTHRLLILPSIVFHASSAQHELVDTGPMRFPVQKRKQCGTRYTESYKQVANDTMHAVALTLLSADERSHRNSILLKKLASTFSEIFRMCEARIRQPDYQSARFILATTTLQNIECLLKATVKRTSVHDSSSCASLCECLELSLPVLTESCVDIPAVMQLDWNFWIDILRRLVDSENTTTQIRALSTLYNIWDIFPTSFDVRRKLVEWLLAADVFAKLFLHYSSWVRCFYMHVICWRVTPWIKDPSITSIGIQAKT